MQKYVYRYVVIAIFTISVLFGQSNNITTDDGRIKEDLKKALDKNSVFYKTLKEKSFTSMEQFGSTKYTKDILKTYKSESEQKSPYMFYFFSENVGITTLKNLLPQFKKFKKINSDIEIYVVFNGFPSKKIMQEIRTLYEEDLTGLFTIKIHPPMYQYFNLENVPAYVLTECPKDFRFKQCSLENAFLVRGNISIVDLFEVLSEKNQKYKTTYFKLVEAK